MEIGTAHAEEMQPSPVQENMNISRECQCQTQSQNKKHLKNVGPFATASHRYIASHQVSLVARHSAGGVRCPRQQQQQQRQHVTEGTTMAPWNGPN